MFNYNHFCKYVHVWINEMFVKDLCNETLSKTNFPLGRIKVHLSIYLSWRFILCKNNVVEASLTLINQ